MKIYHSIAADSLPSVLKDGLDPAANGDSTDDEAIVRTDKFLDAHRLSSVANIPLSREHALYGYLPVKDGLIDIRDGRQRPLSYFLADGSQVLLALEVHGEHCFVSDLGRYDKVKTALEAGEPTDVCRNLALDYWKTVVPLYSYTQGTVRRPEIIVTVAVKPEHITVITS